MKSVLTAVVLSLISTGAAPAQTSPAATGDWSIYSSAASSGHAQVLIQASSEEQYANSFGAPVHAKLDAVCTGGKLTAIAVDISSTIPQAYVDESGPVYTTRVSYQMEDMTAGSELWAVLDHGRTISPYAQVMQGRLLRKWADRLVASDRLVLSLNGARAGEQVTATFGTAGFAEALASAGCRY